MVRLTALALLCLNISCSAIDKAPAEPERKRGVPSRPDVILITIDAVRADHVSAHGYSIPTTPYLEKLAESAVTFERAYSTSSWTSPSVASLMTAHYPSRHGVTHGTWGGEKIYIQPKIPAEMPLLAERMRDLGYRTFAIIANGVLNSKFGFARGFDHFEYVGFNNTSVVHRSLVKIRPKLKRGKPYFLWIHLFDPHWPYRARQPWFKFFWGTTPHGQMFDSVQMAHDYWSHNLSGLQLDYLKACYDTEIRATDDFIAKFLTVIDNKRPRLTIITADHGEEFMDHGRFFHGLSLYEESIRIPLIIAFPGGLGAGKKIDTPVSLVDIAPTILDLVGAPRANMGKGFSLLPLVRGENFARQQVHVEYTFFEDAMAIVRRYDKLVVDKMPPTYMALYNLETDPAEKSNLSRARPDQTNDLLFSLALHSSEVLQNPNQGAQVELPPFVAERLRSLGYCAGSDQNPKRDRIGSKTSNSP